MLDSCLTGLLWLQSGKSSQGDRGSNEVRPLRNIHVPKQRSGLEEYVIKEGLSCVQLREKEHRCSRYSCRGGLSLLDQLTLESLFFGKRFLIEVDLDKVKCQTQSCMIACSSQAAVFPML